MNPSLRSPVDPLACPECGMLWQSDDLAYRCCADDPFAPIDDNEIPLGAQMDPDVEDEMTEAEREELLAGWSTAQKPGMDPEQLYTAAVADYIEARRAVQDEELKRAEIELVAIEELVTNGQARSQTAAKEMKTLHPDYRQHKERLNALELAVTRAEALVEVRKAQMWRSVYAAALTE